MDLYTFGTPNGFKASIALEELGLPYKVHRIDIHKGDQSTPEYIKINPNSKIPALVDDGFVVFESVAILIYLAEKTGKLMPKDPKGRSEVLQWCLFQAAGVGPMFGQYGHFAVYAKEKVPYAIERYGKEVARLLGVLNDRLEKSAYLGGDRIFDRPTSQLGRGSAATKRAINKLWMSLCIRTSLAGTKKSRNALPCKKACKFRDD